MSSNPSDEIINDMILDGLVEPAAMDMETGEMLYSFTDKAREEMPDLWAHAQRAFGEMITYFWENGFVNINMADADPMVTVAPKALDPAEVEKLSPDLRQALRVILEALRIR